MRFKMNLQLFSDENTMDFGDADTGTYIIVTGKQIGRAHV